MSTEAYVVYGLDKDNNPLSISQNDGLPLYTKIQITKLHNERCFTFLRAQPLHTYMWMLSSGNVILVYGLNGVIELLSNGRVPEVIKPNCYTNKDVLIAIRKACLIHEDPLNLSDKTKEIFEELDKEIFGNV